MKTRSKEREDREAKDDGADQKKKMSKKSEMMRSKISPSNDKNHSKLEIENVAYQLPAEKWEKKLKIKKAIQKQNQKEEKQKKITDYDVSSKNKPSNSLGDEKDQLVSNGIASNAVGTMNNQKNKNKRKLRKTNGSKQLNKPEDLDAEPQEELKRRIKKNTSIQQNDQKLKKKNSLQNEITSANILKDLKIKMKLPPINDLNAPNDGLFRRDKLKPPAPPNSKSYAVECLMKEKNVNDIKYYLICWANMKSWKSVTWEHQNNVSEGAISENDMVLAAQKLREYEKWCEENPDDSLLQGIGVETQFQQKRRSTISKTFFGQY